MADTAGLIDGIYEAAIVPEQWPRVLEALSRRSRAAFGSLFVVALNAPMRFTGTPASNELISAYLALERPIENPRLLRGQELASQGFITDQDIAGDGSLYQHPFYQDFMYPRGYGWVAGTSFALSSGETVYVSFERRRENGNMEPECVADLNGFRPHLRRAAILAAKLGLVRATGMTQALEALGLAGAVLKANGGLYAANASFEALMPDLVQDRRDRVALVEPGADKLLAGAIGRLIDKSSNLGVHSIPVAAKLRMPPFIFHLVPLRGAASDIFSQGLALLLAMPVDRAIAPGVEVLQGLFDFTPAEARVARAIAGGKTIEGIALENRISRETVRSQLAAALGKTGLNRQAELAALLGGKGIGAREHV